MVDKPLPRSSLFTLYMLSLQCARYLDLPICLPKCVLCWQGFCRARWDGIRIMYPCGIWPLDISSMCNIGEFPDGDEWWGGRFSFGIPKLNVCHYVPIIQVSDIRTAIEGRGWSSKAPWHSAVHWIYGSFEITTGVFFLWILTCCLMLDSVAALMVDTLRYTYELVQKSIPEFSKKS